MTLKTRRDTAFDTLLNLDGCVLVLDEAGRYWIKFSVKRVAASQSRPNGIKYSLTLHGPRNERILGFDNAHASRRSGRGPRDHLHRPGSVEPYVYADAGQLIEDFWAAVDRELRKRGIFR